LEVKASKSHPSVVPWSGVDTDGRWHFFSNKTLCMEFVFKIVGASAWYGVWTCGGASSPYKFDQHCMGERVYSLTCVNRRLHACAGMHFLCVGE
jgi:hypothetical protein